MRPHQSNAESTKDIGGKISIGEGRHRCQLLDKRSPPFASTSRAPSIWRASFKPLRAPCNFSLLQPFTLLAFPCTVSPRSHLRRWWLPSYLLCQGLKDAARCRDLADALATLPCTASSLRSAADGDVPFTTRSWVRRSVAASDGRLRLGKKKEKRAEE